MRNETPEYALGDREGKGNEDYSQKRRQSLFNFSKIDLTDASKHRRPDQNQNRRGCVSRNHARQRREKETRQKTESSEHGSHACAAAAADAGDALDVSSAR